MAFSNIGGKIKDVLSRKDQDLLEAAKSGNVEAIEKLTLKRRQSTATQFISSFLKGPVNINCVDREGYTPLHLATLNGHKPAVECLLNLEASLTFKDNSGCTPLHLAAWKGLPEICQIFLSQTNTQIPLDSQNSLGDTALHMAAQYGYKDVVDLLLQNDADTKIRNLKEESALDLAAQYGRQEAVQLIIAKNPDLVKHTLTKHSPLHLAAACGHVQVIHTLLDAGFDINTSTVTGTALHTASLYCKTEVVRVLLEKGIDVHAVDGSGKTALEIVAKNDQSQSRFADIAKIIRDHIMGSGSEEANMYETAFNVVKSGTPSPSPKMEKDNQKKEEKPKTPDKESETTENKTRSPEVKQRPKPKPRPSIGSSGSEDERKSSMYTKPDKKSPQRLDEEPEAIYSNITVTPQPSPRHLSHTPKTPELGEPPVLPIKERDSTPPLPPKSDDIPLLPPKILSPSADMVVADFPPCRAKSQEILESPPACQTSPDVDSAGYFVMKSPPQIDPDIAKMSPASKKKIPAKPPRKKSPAPSRKNSNSPLSVHHPEITDTDKEEYETMANVPRKKSEDDVYKGLYTGYTSSESINSTDAIVESDPMYTNIESVSTADKHVPFTDYKEGEPEKTKPPNVNSSTRESTGFQQGDSKPEKASTVSDLTKERNSASVSSKQSESTKLSDTGSVNKKCDSVVCDTNENIPINSSSKISNIPDHSTSMNSNIPKESCDNVNNVPKPLQSESSIPQTLSNIPSENVIPTSCQNDQISVKENSGKSTERPSSDGSVESSKKTSNKGNDQKSKPEIPSRKSLVINQESPPKVPSRKSLPESVPDLPPKSSTDVPGDLVVEEKRLSNGTTETGGNGKVAKPKSLELTKKLIEEEFPTTPTGYPQPPTPDFPPPSPHTAQKGIEQKIAEVSSTKRQSRDMETYTDDLTTNENQEKPESDQSKPTADSDRQSGGFTTESVRNKSMEDQRGHKEDSPVVYRKSARSSSGSQEILAGDDLAPFAVEYVDPTTQTLLTLHEKEEGCRNILSHPSNDYLQPRGCLDQGQITQRFVPGYLSITLLTGLLRGSVTGGPRRVVSQIYEHVGLPHQRPLGKRSSLPITGMTFEPLMEGEEDGGHEKLIKSERGVLTEMKSTRIGKEDGSFDDECEWDQIANIMASFGAGIDRESVFVEKFEALFTKHLTGSGKSTNVHSVGEWLESLGLGQYENTLCTNGFDDTDFLGEKIMEDQDLESIGITTAEHRKKILDHAKTLPQIVPISANNPPASVKAWLDSLHLPHYLDKFISHKYDTIERVLQVWELELSTVLDISSLGHRKRILASLGDRSPPDRQFASLKKKSRVDDHKENKSPFNEINLFKDYTKVKPLASTSEEDVRPSSKPETPSVENSDDDVFQNNLQGQSIKDTSIQIRPPNQANVSATVKQWRHRPEMLIKGHCNYTAQYLGSTLVKELTGTDSTIEGIAKLKKSADAIAKIPTIMLSISYRGVKFIDARSKKVICDHEIVNIFCACQDAENMNFFAYITRDNETTKHYCHVFSVKTADLAREIIMTLGEAFEVAYQMAQKERAAEEAREFERTLSQSDADGSSKSSSKASLNTV